MRGLFDAPLCKTCSDMYFVRRHGEIVPCPSCCCDVCSRPRGLHPDCGGCICERVDTERPDRLIVHRSLTVRIVSVED